MKITWHASFRGRLYDAVTQALLAGEWPVAMDKDEILSMAVLLRGGDPDCPACREQGLGMGPSHQGSPRCESGALASGGDRSHCSCDVCF